MPLPVRFSASSWVAPPVGRPSVLLERARRAAILGDLAEAVRLYREVLRLDPLNLDAINLLAVTLFDEGATNEALALLDDAIRIDPEQPRAWANKGLALERQCRFDEALVCMDRSIAIDPEGPHGRFIRGGLLYLMGRFEESLADYRSIVTKMPNSPDVPTNIACALHALGRTAEALRAFSRGLALDPKHVNAIVNKAFVLMLIGDYKRGWRLYESRYQVPEYNISQRKLDAPIWLGNESLEGKTLLIHAEQGLGDSLQFCRYAGMAAAAGADVVLETPRPLVRLMRTLPGPSRIIAEGDPLPPFDLHCPMMSLPLAFGTTPDTIPAPMPYLRATPESAAEWADRLAHLRGFRVGVVWAGSSRTGNPGLVATDRRRSMPFREFTPLAAMPGHDFISLQLGPPAAQAASPPDGFVLHDFTRHIGDFADTAGLIENLDLVIGVDTSTPHLAGAMGKPVWLLNRFDTCWRWFLDRADSPWYPSMRIFRQPTPGDWASTMRDVAVALRTLGA